MSVLLRLLFKSIDFVGRLALEFNAIFSFVLLNDFILFLLLLLFLWFFFRFNLDMVFLIYLIRIFRLIGMTLDEFQTRLLLLLLVLLSLCDSRLLLFIDYHDWFFSRWGHLCRVFDHDYRVSLLRTFNHLWRRRRLHKYFDRYSFFIFSLCTTFILLNHVYVYFVYWSDVLHGLVNDFRLATLRLER